MKKTILTLTASLFAVLAPAQNLISSGSPLYKLPYKNTYVMQTLVAENTFRTATGGANRAMLARLDIGIVGNPLQCRFHVALGALAFGIVAHGLFVAFPAAFAVGRLLPHAVMHQERNASK